MRAYWLCQPQDEMDIIIKEATMFMPMKIGTGIAATAIAVAATSALADGAYDQLDANKDGEISRSEATVDAELYKRWDQLDANSDGVLDQGEFAQFEAEPAEGTELPDPNPGTDMQIQ